MELLKEYDPEYPGVVTIIFAPMDGATHSIEIQNVLGQVLYKDDLHCSS
jgi:hypothetical protein